MISVSPLSVNDNFYRVYVLYVYSVYTLKFSRFLEFYFRNSIIKNPPFC